MPRKNLPILPGYTRIPKDSARRYIDPTGNIISRRQYEDVRVQKIGWKSWSEYQKTARRNDEWIRDRGIYSRNKGIKKTDIGPDSEFAKKFLAQRREKELKGAEYDRSPDGPMADYLVYVGLRQPEDYWDVGDTPTK